MWIVLLSLQHIALILIESCVDVHIVTVVKELETADSYALWTPQPDYSAVNASTQKDTELSLLFRTRQTNGILFYAASFSRLEHAILEVILAISNLLLLLLLL